MTAPAELATPDLLRVPADEAQKLLRGTIRFVADIPKGATPELVWTLGRSELLVHTDSITLSCDPGRLTIAVTVDCDQLKEAAPVRVPIAVGTLKQPTGLVMSTLTRPAGPAVVVDLWAETLIAFAWEGVLHLAERLCAAAGKDASGRPLVPAAIGAERGLLLVQPAARQRRTVH